LCLLDLLVTLLNSALGLSSCSGAWFNVTWLKCILKLKFFFFLRTLCMVVANLHVTMCSILGSGRKSFCTGCMLDLAPTNYLLVNNLGLGF